MPNRADEVFTPIPTTAPSFLMGGSTLFASTTIALQSSVLNRTWSGPGGRSVRLAEKDSRPYYVNFGTGSIAASSTDSILVLGGSVETFGVGPSVTHLAVKSVSTTTGTVVNVTPGYGF